MDANTINKQESPGAAAKAVRPQSGAGTQQEPRAEKPAQPQPAPDPTRLNRIVYFVLSISLVLTPFLQSGGSIVPALLVALALLIRLCGRKAAGKPAAAFLPEILLADVSMWLLLQLSGSPYDPEQLPQLVRWLYTEEMTAASLALLFTGCAALFLGLKRHIGWLNGLGSAMLAAVPAVLLINAGVLPADLRLVYIAAPGLVWLWADTAARRVNPDRGWGCGVLLLLVWALLMPCAVFSSGSFDWLRIAVPMGIWYYAAAVCLVLLGWSAVLCDRKRQMLGPDAYILISLALGVALYYLMNQFLYTNGAVYGGGLDSKIMLLLLAAGQQAASLWGLGRETAGKKMLRRKSVDFLFAVFACCVLLGLLLGRGLYVNALITAAFGVALYLEYRKPEAEAGHLRWYLIPAMLGGEEIGLLATGWTSADTGGVYLAAAGMTIAAQALLNRPGPDGRTAPKKYKILVTAVLAALYGAALIRRWIRGGW